MLEVIIVILIMTVIMSGGLRGKNLDQLKPNQRKYLDTKLAQYNAMAAKKGKPERTAEEQLAEMQKQFKPALIGLIVSLVIYVGVLYLYFTYLF